MNKTREQVAGYLYVLTCQAIRSSGTASSMLATHIVGINEGTRDYKGPLWQRRELEPDGRIVELSSFKDYLLLPEREGLGLQSLMMAEGIVRCHKDPNESAQAMRYLEELIPDFWETVKAERAKLAAGLMHGIEPAGQHGGNRKNGEAQKTKRATKGGRSDYFIARLKRDAQTNPNAGALLDKVLAGQITVNAASVAMGYRKKSTLIDRVIKELPHLSAEDKATLYHALHEDLQAKKCPTEAGH